MADMDVTKWWEYANSIFPQDRSTRGYAVSDTAYDTLREKYYYEVMAPEIAKQGMSPAASKDVFMEATGRPGKAKFPRAELVGKNVLAGLVAPIAGTTDNAKELRQLTEGAQREASRQGIGPVQAGALSMVGQGIGMAPYFASPTMAARQLGMSIAGPMGRAMLEVPVVGAIQGLYDAASADDGHRVSAGLEGFALGAGFAAGFEGIGALRKTLKRNHGLTDSEAAAVADSMHGTADDVQQTIANTIINQQPAIGDTIEQSVKVSKDVARRLGTPDLPSEVEHGSSLRLQMQGADGKNYFVSGFNDKNVDQIIERVDKHLQMGGKIIQTFGDETEINKLYKALESKIEMEVPVSVAGQEVKVRTFSQEPTPSTVSLETKGALSRVEMRNDGSVFDPVSDTAFQNLESFFRAKGLRYESAAPARQEPTGFFYSPQGKKLGVDSHESFIRDIFKGEGRQLSDDPVMDALEIGWVRRRGDGIEVHGDFINKDQTAIAVMDAFGEGRNAIAITSFPFTPSGGLTLPRSMMEDFINNPKKILLQLKQQWKDGIRYELSSGKQVKFDPLVELKERALAMRGQTGVPMMGMTQPTGMGQKPIIIYGSEANKGTVFHENLHGHFSYLGIDQQIASDIGKLPHAQVLSRALPASAQKYANEELATYLTTAVRTNDTEWLNRFVAADEDLPTVLQTASQVAGVVKSRALQTPNSLNQRILVRRMDAVQRRAGVITDLEHTATRMGKELSVRDGKFTLTDAASSKTFDTRDSLMEHMERLYDEPLNAPNLIDESYVPDFVPRFERKSPTNPPISTVPPLPPSGKIKGGMQAMSFFVRPFYSWVDTVARKNKYPELYSTFKGLDTAMSGLINYEKSYEGKFKNIFNDISPDKRKGISHYLANPTEEMAAQLNLSVKDIAKANRVLNEVIAPLSHDMGFEPQHYFEYMRQHRASGKVVPNERLPKDKLAAVENGVQGIDPRDTDIGWISNSLLRNSGRTRHLEPQLRAAENIIDAKVEGEYVLGTLRPLFKRHVDFMRTRPDQSLTLMNSAADAVIESLNDIITSSNKKLPGALQMPKIETSGKDALGKMMLFSYAGSMGLRPMTVIRDGFQVITNTLPMLGPKYFNIGMARAFGGVKEGRASNAYKVAREYGALIEHNDLQNLFAAGNESLVGGKMTKLADWMLLPMQIANNSNRLVSFWGHSEKALDALKSYGTDPKMFLKKSGLIYADEGLQKMFLEQLPLARTGDQMRDLSFKIGKEMTDLSQWNYHRGAHPGIYKYALGRLLGQYGTWPLNYIEYGRRLARSGDAMDKVAAMTGYTMAHAAILKGGEALGIDTASWVFTSPLAYGGGPMMSTAQAALTAFDTQGQRGEQARRQLGRQLSMSVPGGMAAENIYDAIMTDDPNLMLRLWGFNPLEDSDMTKGLHGLTQ